MFLLIPKRKFGVIMDDLVRERLKDILLGMQGGMPQRKFAKVLGVSHSSLASWIRGESFPSHDSLIKIAGVAKISLDELLNRLKGEVEVKPIRRAEDLLPQVNILTQKERLRLLKLIAEQIVE